MSSIDISEDYLLGFVIVSTTPVPKSNMRIPIDASRSFIFELLIPPGETRDFSFRLKGVTAGMYRGDVDACEGLQFLTTLAQTKVSEAE